MQATIVDLRYHMKDVLSALRRNEKITVLYRGKKIATLSPISEQQTMHVRQHPFFGMMNEDTTPVETQMNKLRGGRYRDI